MGDASVVLDENEIVDVMLRRAGKSGEEKMKFFFEKQLTTEMKLCYNKPSKEREVRNMGHIKNLPAYADEYKYVVARKADGDWWFWGAYNDFRAAGDAAWEIDGDVFTKWCAA